jgi:hypothetical protein
MGYNVVRGPGVLKENSRQFGWKMGWMQFLLSILLQFLLSFFGLLPYERIAPARLNREAEIRIRRLPMFESNAALKGIGEHNNASFKYQSIMPRNSRQTLNSILYYINSRE